MKKLLLIFAIALISLTSFSQITYKNLTVKEKTHYQDNIYNEVYVVVNDVKVNSMNSLSAIVELSIYKSKEIYLQHPEWSIKTNEIGNIEIPFEFGDSINRETIANGIKEVLLYLTPTWSEANIVIE